MGSNLILVSTSSSMVSEIELTTQQEYHIASAIDQSESNSNRFGEEEKVLTIKDEFDVSFTSS